MARSTSSITGRNPQTVTSSGDSIEWEPNSLQTSNNGTRPRNIHVRVAYDEGSKQYSCDLLAVDAANQGEDLITKLHEMNEGDSGAFLRFIAACGDAFLMRQDSVWLVSVSSLSSNAATDPEMQPAPQRVYIEHSECSEPLTQAFHHPEQLRFAKDFVLAHLEGVVDDNCLVGIVPGRALCLGKIFKRKAAFVWFAVALVLCTGTGVGAGLSKRDLGLGIAVEAGMLAVLAGMQVVLFWRISSARV